MNRENVVQLSVLSSRLPVEFGQFNASLQREERGDNPLLEFCGFRLRVAKLFFAGFAKVFASSA